MGSETLHTTRCKKGLENHRQPFCKEIPMNLMILQIKWLIDDYFFNVKFFYNEINDIITN